MENTEQSGDFGCVRAILSCFALSVIYVASLYVWTSPFNREHPKTIKQRFCSVFVVSLISPLSLYLGLDRRILSTATVWELLGLRWAGLFPAFILSWILTMILFLGPLALQAANGYLRIVLDPRYWLPEMKTLHWWRNLVVAPLSEELIFRSCILPLLLQCFSPSKAIPLSTLFFGLAHFHHLVEQQMMGMPLKHAILVSCFQFGYTMIFGAYAAFLFVRTGHLIAPVIAHSFCNFMGFPDFSVLMAQRNPLKKLGFICMYLLGLVSWYCLLSPMTNPRAFSNNLFWHKQL